MKRDNLRTGVMISGFLLVIVFVIVIFCCTFCGKIGIQPIEPESQLEISIYEITTETEISTDVTTESTTTVIETTSATPEESTTTVGVVTETTYEQAATTSEELVQTSDTVVTETTPTQIYELTTTSSAPVTLKGAEEIALEVWQGSWGNGDERKERLEAAGYDYDEIQKAVCEVRKTFNQSTTATASIEDTPSGLKIQFVKTFSRGTYYAYGGPRVGGSQRQLIDCSQGSGGIKGSVASWELYNKYKYNYNGERTLLYLEIHGYPQMNGLYYLDDSSLEGVNDVIDFFYLYNSNCQFQNQGVVQVDCSIVLN